MPWNSAPSSTGTSHDRARDQMSDVWQVEPHAIIPELEPDYPARGFTVAQHIDPQLAAQLRQLAAINTMANLDLEDDN